LVPGGEVESPCLAAAVFETATSTDSVTPARDVAALECVLREARIIRQTWPSHNLPGQVGSPACNNPGREFPRLLRTTSRDGLQDTFPRHAPLWL